MPALQHGNRSEGGTNLHTKLNHVQNWLELARQSKWSVSGLAETCGLSMRTLELYFLKKYHKTPKSWLVEERQTQGLKLLSEGFTVKETAGRLGYKHTHHFSRDFKKRWGHCPTAVRQNIIRVPDFVFW